VFSAFEKINNNLKLCENFASPWFYQHLVHLRSRQKYKLFSSPNFSKKLYL